MYAFGVTAYVLCKHIKPIAFEAALSDQVVFMQKLEKSRADMPADRPEVSEFLDENTTLNESVCSLNIIKPEILSGYISSDLSESDKTSSTGYNSPWSVRSNHSSLFQPLRHSAQREGSPIVPQHNEHEISLKTQDDIEEDWEDVSVYLM